MQRRLASVTLLVLAIWLGSCSPLPQLETRDAVSASADFGDATLLVLSDGDMSATAYADGKLYLAREARDSLALVDASGTVVRTVPGVANSVAGWPGSLDVSPDGRFVYVIEVRGAAAPGTAKVKSIAEGLPAGRMLTTVDLQAKGGAAIVATRDLGAMPTSVQVAPNGRWLLVSTTDPARDLLAVTLNAGMPERVVGIDLDLPASDARPQDSGVRFARVRPQGDVVALNIDNAALRFARLQPGADGIPAGATLVGPAVNAGKWLAMGRFAADGRHYLATDVAWGPGTLDAATNGPGSIAAVRYDDGGAHRVVSTAQVSLSPESFELSPDGRLLAVVNMERTYLPGALPYSLFGRRSRSSLSLVAFDPESGALRTIDGPLGFRGVLPEAAAFSGDGRTMAVIVYQDHDDPMSAGWIDYFTIRSTASGPLILPTGRRTPMPRGGHGLAVVRTPPSAG